MALGEPTPEERDDPRSGGGHHGRGGERDTDDEHEARAAERPVLVAREQRRGHGEREEDDGEAREHRGGLRQVARQPGDARLAARDAVEEQPDEPQEDRDREERDGGDDDRRQRRAHARRERVERANEQAGQPLGVVARRLEERQHEEEPAVRDRHLQEAVAERDGDGRRASRRAGAQELDVAEANPGDAVGVVHDPRAETLGEVGHATEQEKGEQRGEDDERQ